MTVSRLEPEFLSLSQPLKVHRVELQFGKEGQDRQKCWGILLFNS